jgi:hypothetical protein
MSAGRQGDAHPAARIVLAALFVLTVILVTVLLFRRLAAEGTSGHGRYLPSGCILAVGIGAFAVAGLVSARQKRTRTAALEANAPIRIPTTRIRLLMFSFVGGAECP